MANVFVLGLGLLGATSAAAELVEVQLQPGQSMQRQFSAEPGQFVEVCAKLAQGQALDWQFDASGRTDFNIHYHLGKKVKYPERRSAVRAAAGRLQVRLDQDHCWMWVNPGAAAVTIKTRIAAQRKP
jgi:hypothetical protein